MVLIKGMEMPKKCRECPFARRYPDESGEMFCTFPYCTTNYCKDGETIHPNCPLISVDSVIEQMEEKKAIYGAEFTRGTYEFNRGIDACIAILRGLEEK